MKLPGQSRRWARSDQERLSFSRRLAPAVPRKSFGPVRRRRVFACRCALGAVLLIGATFLSAPAQAVGGRQSASSNLGDATIEQLMNIEVVSASKKSEKLSRVAAAIYVITQDDIRRSGATSVPDLLRMVPGLDVAQINANTWAISSRGFNSEFADKMLVLIDGRTVYNPLFSGVFWNIQDLPLEDIDRIEVIRGPGATVWGANAVNGVINIITKSTKDTHGGLLSTGWGNAEGPFTTLQYGGALGKNADYRVYGKYFDRNSFFTSPGRHAADGWNAARGGFRSDWDPTVRDSMMFEGSGYHNGVGGMWTGAVSYEPFVFGPFNQVTDFNGGSVLGRWKHTLRGGSQTQLQMYFEHFNLQNSLIGLNINSFDVEFQHHIALGTRNDVVWGLGYRHNAMDTAGGIDVSFSPADIGTNLYSTFIQDEIALVNNHVWLTLGSKLEHNYFTGFEVEPSARLLYQPTARNTLWAAVSRATRTPSPADDDSHVLFGGIAGPGGLPTLAYAQGDPDFASEDLLAYEVGYRGAINKKVALDLASYYNVYDNLRGSLMGEPYLVTAGPLPFPYAVIPLQIGNFAYGRTYGGEVSLDWKVAKRWSIHPGYAAFAGILHAPTTPGPVAAIAENVGDNPRHQFQIRSEVDLPKRFEFNTSVYYVDRLVDQNVPAYTRVDTQITWHAGEAVDLSAVGQNLLNPYHVEFRGSEDLIEPTEIPRSAYLKITWRF